MKFNEKLIQLRKKEGLSQEELGYKLNVTRQTVSKWELGQTTPEMDKLVEMSKIFNISVDDLINESELVTEINNNENPIIEDQPIIEKSNKEKNVKIIIVGVLVIVIVLIVVKLLASFSNKVANTMEQGTETSKNIFEKFFGIFDKALDQVAETQKNFYDKTADTMNQITETYNQIESQIGIGEFNNSIELYAGTTIGGTVIHVLDNIITSNKTGERKITVKYGETETQNESEIKSIKQSIDTFNKYEITFEYDVNGFINKAIIEKL